MKNLNVSMKIFELQVLVKIKSNQSVICHMLHHSSASMGEKWDVPKYAFC